MENNNLDLIAKFAKSGEDVFVSKNVEIKRPENVVVGNHIAIDSGFKCTTKLEMGDYIHIAPDVVIIGGQLTSLKLDHFSFIASGTKVVCGSDFDLYGGLIGPTIPEKHRNLVFEPVIFEKFAGVGVNCSIMPGVVLAEGSVVGANSLVIKSTKPWTIYIGSPAKPIGKRDKETTLKHAKELGY